MQCVSKSLKAVCGMVMALLAASAWAGSPAFAGADPLVVSAAAVVAGAASPVSGMVVAKPSCLELARKASDCKLVWIDVTLIDGKGGRNTAHLTAFVGNTTEYSSYSTVPYLSKVERLPDGEYRMVTDALKTGVWIEATPGLPMEEGVLPVDLVVKERRLADPESYRRSGVNDMHPNTRELHVQQRIALKPGVPVRVDRFDDGATRAIEVVARVMAE